MYRTAIERRERGMVLVTALILLAVLTLIAVVAMRTTTLDLRMGTNAMLKARAFESSEGARVQVPDPLDDHVFYRGWPGGDAVGNPGPDDFDMPSELVIVDVTRNLYAEVKGADLGDYSDSVRDMTYRVDGDASGAVSAKNPTPADISSDIYITNLGAVAAAGSATSMVSGYEGFGKGTAAGGSHLMFDLRARGHAANRTEGITGSHVRVLVRN